MLIICSLIIKYRILNFPFDFSFHFFTSTVTDTMLTEGNDLLLKYPFETDSVDVVSLYHCDLMRLRPGEFLNDSLIDFYIKYAYSSV